MTALTGRAWVFGDNIDTDVLAPGIYMKGSMAELARHCLESVDPAFAANVKPGDIVVAGENFGIGSSREQAAQALIELGIAALVAKSFARIFYRNAINLGLPALACPEAGKIAAGDTLTLDPASGELRIASSGESLACEPIPPHLLAMIADGGLIPHLKKKLKEQAA
ncbi:MAG: 3-isopropylmalate dehydratase small subunit [Alphaproteobacteria bacterium]|nr:3-isopropylmalate dehydratase small subunit [Alphaproteobacteria bacterium]